MDTWKNTVITDRGIELQTKLLDGQGLKITKVKAGAGQAPLYDLRSQTEVLDIRQEINLRPAVIKNNQITIPVFLENTKLPESYDLWQIGFYAEDQDGNEILYCLSQAARGRFIPAANESPGFSITWEFCFKNSDAAPFELDIDPSGFVSLEEYNVHSAAIDSLEADIQQILSYLYPVGMVIAFAEKFNPNDSLPGTWKRFAEGKTLMGVNENDSDFIHVEKPGGSKTHLHSTGNCTLNTRQLPSHDHGQRNLSGTFRAYCYKGWTHSGIISGSSNALTNDMGTGDKSVGGVTFTVNASHKHDAVGENQPHNHGNTGNRSNLPPYVTVYYWRRES